MSDIPPPFQAHEPQQPPSPEPVWTYRGYQLRASDFTTSMVHLFRAEVQRANVWRSRLDATTNWAVVATGAAISFAFGSNADGSHAVIIMDTLLVTLFLFIEARRYRYYELWSSRVRLMETDFFAAMLVPPFRPAPDWAESLAENLLHPSYPISRWEALGRRMRRNYLWIYMLLGVVWFLKVWIHPVAATSWQEFLDRASIGGIPGQYVLLFGLIYNGVLVLIGLLTQGLREASGEVLPRYGDFDPRGLFNEQTGVAGVRAWFRREKHRQQILTLIITDQPDVVSQRIIKDMHRGVTKLEGTGMYTGKAHGVLLCALTVTEVPLLKSLVVEADPNGFVIVTPVQEILGGGFMPLQKQN
jgi:uncharacterized membrane protein